MAQNKTFVRATAPDTIQASATAPDTIQASATAPDTIQASATAPDTIQAIGGYGAQPFVIGGRANFERMDRRDKWNAHKEHGKKEYTIYTVNEILQLPEHIDDKHILKEVIRQIWNSPTEQIINGIAKSSELNEPLTVAYRTLFWKLKELIEAVVLLYLRYMHNSDIRPMISKWKRYVEKNHIDTSSIILWILFGKNSEIAPPKIKEHKLVADLKFNYLGYCPNAPAERIVALMQFPVDKLLKQIAKKADVTVNFSDIIKTIMAANKVDLPKMAAIKCKKSKIKNTNDFYAYIDQFMAAWLDFNDCIHPYLEKIERHYIDLAKKIDKTSKELDAINSKLLKNIQIEVAQTRANN